jgi:hypothetical protein
MDLESCCDCPSDIESDIGKVVRQVALEDSVNGDMFSAGNQQIGFPLGPGLWDSLFDM